MKKQSLLACLAASAVLGATLAPAAAAPSPSSSAGASWLAADLEANGLFEYPTFPATDYGLNIDAGFAMLAAGDTAGATAQLERLEPVVAGYFNGDEFDPGATYVNALAKLTAFVEAVGADPTDFADTDLVARLEAQVGDGTDGTTVGRIFDTSTYGDYANIIGQGFAARALAAAGSDQAAAVVEELVDQQCDDLSFPLAFSGDGSCETPDASVVDVTALTAVGGRPGRPAPRAAGGRNRAATYLASQQDADGSIRASDPTAAPNSNTTGLAAWALGQACNIADAYRSAAWVRALQVRAGDPESPLADEVGAVAFDAATLERDQADGIAASERDQYRRATAQAANGLAYDPQAPSSLTLTGPGAGYVKAGTSVTFRVDGIVPGDAACLVGPTGPTLIDDDSASASVRIAVGQHSGTQSYQATAGPGLVTTTVKVLAGKRLWPKTATQVRRGAKQRVTLQGLAPYEQVRIVVAGKQVVSGGASAQGTFIRTFTLPRSTPLGTRTLRAVGQFGTRVGTKRFTVLPAR